MSMSTKCQGPAGCPQGGSWKTSHLGKSSLALSRRCPPSPTGEDEGGRIPEVFSWELPSTSCSSTPASPLTSGQWPPQLTTLPPQPTTSQIPRSSKFAALPVSALEWSLSSCKSSSLGSSGFTLRFSKLSQVIPSACLLISIFSPCCSVNTQLWF